MHKAPEMVNCVKNLISFILEDENEDFDLKDRATFYCKAMQEDMSTFQKTLDSVTIGPDGMFIEDEKTRKVRMRAGGSRERHLIGSRANLKGNIDKHFFINL